MMQNFGIKRLMHYAMLVALVVLITSQVINIVVLYNNNRKTLDLQLDRLREAVEFDLTQLQDSMMKTAQYIISSEAARNYFLNSDGAARKNTRREVQAYIDMFCALMDGVDGIYLINGEGEGVHSTANYSYYEYFTLRSRHLPEYRMKEPVFSTFFFNANTKRNIFAYFTPVNGYGKTGYLMVKASTDTLDDLLKRHNALGDSTALIVDETGQVVAAGDKSQVGMHFDADAIMRNNIVASRMLAHRPLWMYTYLPNSVVFESARYYVLTALIQCAIMALVFVLLRTVIFRTIIKPIEMLALSMSEAPRTKFTARIPLVQINEISELTERYNHLLDDISEYIAETERVNRRMFEESFARQRAELLSKQAQLSMLQNQINPHFLYNTLENMRSIALESGSEEMARTCLSLAKIFRYCIDSRQKATLGEELTCVRSYISIVKLRFVDAYSFRFDIEEGLEGYIVCRMLLQPLVENALYHGLEPMAGGQICIAARLEGKQLVIMVTDDGQGIDANRLNRLNALLDDDSPPTDANIGLHNIANRLRLLYGEMGEMTIRSGERPGTSVVVRIRAECEEDEPWHIDETEKDTVS